MNPRGKKRARAKSKWADSSRLEYLQELKCEFETSKSLDAKHETVANLANFAYNPENFHNLHNLSVHQMFVNNLDPSDNLSQGDEFTALCSLKGLCNLATYPPIALYLCQVLEKIINSLNYKMDSIEFVSPTLLLLITICQSNNNLDHQLHSKIDTIVNQLPPKTKSDSRVNNLLQILMCDDGKLL